MSRLSRAGRLLLVVALLGSLLLALPPPTGASGSPLVTARDDETGRFWFAPTRVEMPAGSVLKVTNGGQTVHTLTASDGVSFDTDRLDVGEDGVIEVPATPGEYPFYCRYHAAPGSSPEEAMAGVLVVTPREEPPLEDGVPGPSLPLVLLGLALVALGVRRGR